MHHIKFIVKCLCENKLRTFLTSFGICIAVASVLLIGAVGDFGCGAVREELDSLGLNGLILSCDSGSIDENEIGKISEVGGIEQCAPVTIDTSRVFSNDDDVSAVVWGIDENAEEVVSFELLCGRFINKGDIKSNGRVCMIDQTLALELFGSENAVGRTVELLQNSAVQSFEVVGVVKTGKGIMQSLMGSCFPAFLYAPYSSFRSEPDFNQAFLKTDGEVPSDELKTSLVRTLGKDVTVTDLASRRSVLRSMMATVTLILTLIGAISLFVSGISIMNIMLISVSERTKEIGIKKAIGASNSDILLDFLLESVIISLTGTLAGTAAALIISFSASAMLGISVTVSSLSVFRALLTAVSLGALFGIFPAYKAASFRPVEALRR